MDHVVEHVLYQVVLIGQEPNHVVGGLDKRFNHYNTSVWLECDAVGCAAPGVTVTKMP